MKFWQEFYQFSGKVQKQIQYYTSGDQQYEPFLPTMLILLCFSSVRRSKNVSNNVPNSIQKASKGSGRFGELRHWGFTVIPGTAFEHQNLGMVKIWFSIIFDLLSMYFLYFFDIDMRIYDLILICVAQQKRRTNAARRKPVNHACMNSYAVGIRQRNGPQEATAKRQSASHHTHQDRRPQQQVPKGILVPATTQPATRWWTSSSNPYGVSRRWLPLASTPEQYAIWYFVSRSS